MREGGGSFSRKGGGYGGRFQNEYQPLGSRLKNESSVFEKNGFFGLKNDVFKNGGCLKK